MIKNKKMKTITVTIPDGLWQKVNKTAGERMISKSSVIRLALLNFYKMEVRKNENN